MNRAKRNPAEPSLRPLPRGGRPTLHDVARSAGVSYSTVARIFSGNTGKYAISEKMRRHVMEVARRHGYSTNPFASTMRSRRSHVIGICGVLTRQYRREPAYSEVNFNRRILGILQHPQAELYNVMVLVRNDDDPALEQKLIGGADYLDGLIYVTPREEHLGVLRHLAQRVPLVVEQAAELHEFHTVSVEQRTAIAECVRLLASRGARHIAMLVHYGPEYLFNRERIAAFRHAMHQAGLAADGEAWVETCETQEQARTVLARMLRRRPRIDGLIAPRDLELIGCLQAIEQAQLELGRDLLLISINETETTRCLRPGISAVRFPTEQVAREAFDLLLRQWGEDLTEVRHITVPAQLIERESTRGAGGSTQ